MKIALYNLTTTTKTGGVENFVWELARVLADYPDCQVDIIGGKSSAGFQHPDPGPRVRILTRPFIARESLRRLPLVRKMYTLTKLVERLSLAVTCLPLLWRERYDIIHIQKPYDLPIGKLLQKRRGAKLLFGCHGKDFFPFDRLFSHKLDGAVSCSHYNAQTVQEHYGLLPAVIYNGIDVERFQPRSPRPDLLARYAQEGDRLVMWVGRLVRWKGAQYLIEALPLLAQSGHRVKVLLAGSGEYQPELVALAARLGVSDQIVFLGNVPNRDLPDYYAICEAVIGTSFANETFGIALAEAAACERPIVASDFGGFREVVQPGITGYLYRPQDPTDLCAKLHQLLSDPARVAAMGRAGRQFVLANFTWPLVAGRVHRVYERLLNQL